jgi:hypothetical protein
VEFEEETDTLKPIWRVEFDDGDVADYYEYELQPWVLDNSDTIELSFHSLAYPHSLLGAAITKSFNGIQYTGTITEHEIDSRTTDTTWRIQYEDNDIEDLNWPELLPHLQNQILEPCPVCVKGSGKFAGHRGRHLKVKKEPKEVKDDNGARKK